MLNVDAFIERLEKIMESHQLSAAAFAEKIGVQRSSVSHILSKRNKPSLDFILKIHDYFDDVSLEYLLLGATPPSSSNSSSTPNSMPLNESNDGNVVKNEKSLFDSLPLEQSNSSIPQFTSEEILQIIQLYADGSFCVFKPKT